MAISRSPYLRVAAAIFGTMCLGFGVNGMLRPRNALTFFEFEPPASDADKKLVDSLLVIYGARDVFMGLVIYAAAYFRDRKILGCTLLSLGGVAFVDGAVVKAQIGTGEWNHWGYAPVVSAVGIMLLGALD